MANSSSRPNERAETYNWQGEPISRSRAAEEVDAVVAEREAKTARLREARLIKERRDMMSATVRLLAKRSHKG